MPNQNQTGPTGSGPMTGRRQGICSTATTGYGRGATNSSGLRRGLGGRNSSGRGGCGYGNFSQQQRGFRNTDNFMEFSDNNDRELEKLKSDAISVQNSLKEINERISELEVQKTSS